MTLILVLSSDLYNYAHILFFMVHYVDVRVNTKSNKQLFAIYLPSLLLHSNLEP